MLASPFRQRSRARRRPQFFFLCPDPPHIIPSMLRGIHLSLMYLTPDSTSPGWSPGRRPRRSLRSVLSARPAGMPPTPGPAAGLRSGTTGTAASRKCSARTRTPPRHPARCTPTVVVAALLHQPPHPRHLLLCQSFVVLIASFFHGIAPVTIYLPPSSWQPAIGRGHLIALAV